MCECGRDLRLWVALLCVFGSGIGCGTTDVQRKPELEALAESLDEIEMVRLEEQSRSEPVSVEEAQAESAEQAAEPNKAEPIVELTLDEARAAALSNNLDLKIQLVDPSIAQRSLDQERAKFEWVFFGSAQHRESMPEDADSASTSSYVVGVDAPLPTGGLLTVDAPFSRMDSDDPAIEGVSDAAVSVSVIQSLLRGAGTRVNTSSILIATYSKDSIDAATKLDAINILGNVDVAYWLLFAARKRLDVTREQYKLAQDQLEHARLKVAAGAAPKIEIVSAEAGLASRLGNVISAETSVRDRDRDLKRIMNREDMPLKSHTGIITTTEPNPLGLNLDAEALVAAALENRMDMVRLRFELAINDIEIELAQNDTLPQLDLSYTYGAGGLAGGTGEAFESIFDDASEDHAVGLTARIPLGNRVARAALQRARLAKMRSELSRERLEQGIRQEVYEAVDALRQNWRRILAAEQDVAAAYRDYQVEQSQFQLGVRRSTDVLLAASRLAIAQLGRISAFVNYEISQVGLARATGTLLGRGQVRLTPLVLEGR
jgi:outer membrane protein TolC